MLEPDSQESPARVRVSLDKRAALLRILDELERRGFITCSFRNRQTGRAQTMHEVATQTVYDGTQISVLAGPNYTPNLAKPDDLSDAAWNTLQYMVARYRDARL